MTRPARILLLGWLFICMGGSLVVMVLWWLNS